MQFQMIFLFIKVQSPFERIWTNHFSYILWQWDTFSSELNKTKLQTDRMDWLWQTVSRAGQIESRKTKEACYTPLACCLKHKMMNNCSTLFIHRYLYLWWIKYKVSVLFSVLPSFLFSNLKKKSQPIRLLFSYLFINTASSVFLFPENYV